MRWVRTRVFPDPGPATISTGPSVARTAPTCWEFKSFKISLITSPSYHARPCRNYQNLLPSKVMNAQKVVDHWINSAEDDIKTVEALWESERYHHCLFFCHLVVEKALKAHVVKKTGEQALPTHDLLLLARKAGLELPPQRREYLSEINTFNVRARYESYKLEFYKKATQEYTRKWHARSMEVFKWLKSKL